MDNISLQKNNAFTLIELLVVIAIIGILSSVVLASLSGARENAKITRLASDLQQIETSIVMWMDGTNKVEFPTDSSFSLGQDPTIEEIANNTTLGNYINSVPEPPFGTTGYRYVNNGNTFTCGAGDDVHHGVTIRIDYVPQDIAEEVDKIMDGGQSADLSCGKFRWESWNSSGRVFYALSNDGDL